MRTSKIPKRFSTIDNMHTKKLIEVSLEYKSPLCLTFIDQKKALDSVEAEAMVEALLNEVVPTQFISKQTHCRMGEVVEN
ncbi:unnamed protein product [Heligmosomoides polygyrus]|uniref:DUF1659 domain-containing protein n=1 Tax=Heligmosomoides polygyrus TaxID=6339 RepID=A0A183GJA2_HELPZ|nr:unnamed protein product [Heligmosomoides polygyrus]